VRNAERLARQEALLDEMQRSGYGNSREYLHLKKETDQLEQFVSGAMKKEFQIKQRAA
jgi:phosphoribulokinase